MTVIVVTTLNSRPTGQGLVCRGVGMRQERDSETSDNVEYFR